MTREKTSGFLIILFAITFFISSSVIGQSTNHNVQVNSINAETQFNPQLNGNVSFDNGIDYEPIYFIKSNTSFQQLADVNTGEEDRKTTSLTVGYIADEYSLQTDGGSYRFRFDGQTKGFMLGSRTSSLMMTYGIADAEQGDGDIRTITADLKFGGNITIFDSFLGLPVGSYIPIRFSLGYRNLDLLDTEDSESNNTANIGSGGVGAGLGAHIRVPTGLPVLQDNLAAYASLVSSVGGMGDLSGASASSDGLQSDESGKAFGGIRLTKHTDFNIEAKFERLLGGNTGVSVGLTLRWLHWTNQEAEDFKQIFDVISGEQEGLKLRGTQSFFRLGINW